MATIKSYTDIEQSKKLAEILPFESADMVYFGIHQGMDGKYYLSGTNTEDDVVPIYKNLCTKVFVKTTASDITCQLPCWSLSALLKLMPKHILRKDKIHYGQTFIPSFRWEITPTAIYYTDGTDIMDYVSFRYGENNIELIDAAFKMVVWLKKNGKI